MKDAKKLQAWAEKVGDKMLNPVLKALDTRASKYSDEEILEVCNHMVTTLVYRMVVDSLSIRVEDMEEYNDEELREIVAAKFQMTKIALESGVTVAFEQAMSEATKQDLEYQCKINRVPTPANTLPC